MLQLISHIFSRFRHNFQTIAKTRQLDSDAPSEWCDSYLTDSFFFFLGHQNFIAVCKHNSVRNYTSAIDLCCIGGGTGQHSSYISHSVFVENQLKTAAFSQRCKRKPFANMKANIVCFTKPQPHFRSGCPFFRQHAARSSFSIVYKS